jgi:hypothetical protein
MNILRLKRMKAACWKAFSGERSVMTDLFLAM